MAVIGPRFPQPLLMHREITERLWQHLAGPPTPEPSSSSAFDPVKLLLRGPVGSGKSCTLVALVERARATGWWVGVEGLVGSQVQGMGAMRRGWGAGTPQSQLLRMHARRKTCCPLWTGSMILTIMVAHQ